MTIEVACLYQLNQRIEDIILLINEILDTEYNNETQQSKLVDKLIIKYKLIKTNYKSKPSRVFLLEGMIEGGLNDKNI